MKPGYRRLWLALACAVAAPGVLVGLVGDTVWVNVAAAATVGVGVGGIAISAYETGSRGAGCRAVVAAGAAGTVICFAVAGLCSLFGPNALLVALLFAVTSPPALRGLLSLVHWPSQQGQLPRHRRLGVEHRGPETPRRPGGMVNARSLSDSELLRAWDVSADQLDRLRVGDDRPQQLLHLALRQQYLDELERRHPETSACWLADGAPTSIGPADEHPPGDHGHDQRRRDHR